MAIHCVTPNPAVDITYRLAAVTLHAVNRIGQVTRRPGGKGVNVARLLAARGHRVAAYGFLGGSPGQQMRDLLHTLQPAIQQQWTLTDAETRLTIAVADDVDTTMFNEPGHPVTADDWDRLTTTVTSRCAPGDVVTISGSLPAGSRPDQLARLVTGTRQAGATVVVDTSGPGLLAAARAGADVLKPNHHELLDVTGATDIWAGISTLLQSGCGAVVASIGADGIILGTGRQLHTASLGRALTGNPTGAGDALVAALANGLAASEDADPGGCLVAALPMAIAWSAAAVLSPVAGEIDPQVAGTLLHEVTTKEL